MMYFKVTDSLGSISVGTTRDLRYYQKNIKFFCWQMKHRHSISR